MPTEQNNLPFLERNSPDRFGVIAERRARISFSPFKGYAYLISFSTLFNHSSFSHTSNDNSVDIPVNRRSSITSFVAPWDSVAGRITSKHPNRLCQSLAAELVSRLLNNRLRKLSIGCAWNESS